MDAINFQKMQQNIYVSLYFTDSYKYIKLIKLNNDKVCQKHN